jgi:hypothetical protein
MRLTDDDKRFGPITYGRSFWRAWSIEWSSGGGEEEYPRNSLTVYALGWVARIPLPAILRPYRIRHEAASWDAATVARLGRKWYYETFPRSYGFRLSEGFLTLFLGAQTHDSSTTQSWSWFLPWRQWRFIRTSYYAPDGSHFYTAVDGKPRDWKVEFDMRDECPTERFEFDDYDGKRIIATCRIVEREWRFGEGWFKWLSLFRHPKIQRSLDLAFSAEVGPEKGSWKGGTVGHSTEMLPGDTPEIAFRRYCDKQHEHKSKRYRIKFVGKVEA